MAKTGLISFRRGTGSVGTEGVATSTYLEYAYSSRCGRRRRTCSGAARYRASVSTTSRCRENRPPS